MLEVSSKHLRAAELSGLSFTEVIVATTVGALVFAEPFSVPVALGIVLIMVAAVVPLVSGSRASARAEGAGEPVGAGARSEEHTSELQSRGHLVCRLLLEKKKQKKDNSTRKQAERLDE